MGKVTGGPSKDWSGKVGSHVFSQQQDGQTIVREIKGTIDVPPTRKQLGNRQIMELTKNFMRPLKEFVNTGYPQEKVVTGHSPFNMMVSYVRKNAIEGKYPDQHIAFSKVLMTQGPLAPPVDASVELSETGFTFKWDASILDDDIYYSDQVIMVAYFPKLKKLRDKVIGPGRYLGSAILEPLGIKHGNVAELYLSFKRAHSSMISDSVYLGQLTW